MTFGASAYLAAMFSPVSKAAVTTELSKLLAILGENDPSLVTELTNTTVRQNVLAEMVLWNARLAPNDQRDRLGHAATKFWAAQALVTTVMLPRALDQSAGPLPGDCTGDGTWGRGVVRGRPFSIRGARQDCERAGIMDCRSRLRVLRHHRVSAR